MRFGVLAAMAAAGAALSVSTVNGAIFNYGNLVVLEATGTPASATAINSLASSVALREFSVGGLATGNIVNLNSGATGTRLTIAGSATSEGQLDLSSDGQYLTLIGYDAAFGTSGPSAGSSIATSTTANVNRVVGAVDLNGNVTYNRITDVFSGGNVRAATTTNGTSFAAVGSRDGLRGLTPPSTNGVLLNTAVSQPTNLRVVNYFDLGSGPEVFVSSATGAFQGVSKLNTSTGALELLPGFPTSSGPSPYDFLFASSSVLYVSDDRTAANGGGLQRWEFNGTQWALAYTISSTTDTANGLRSITIDPSTGEIYGITAAGAAGGVTSLVKIVDGGSAVASTITTLATSASATVFRGVEFIIPAPGTASLLAAFGLVATRRRR